VALSVTFCPVEGVLLVDVTEQTGGGDTPAIVNVMSGRVTQVDPEASQAFGCNDSTTGLAWVVPGNSMVVAAMRGPVAVRMQFGACGLGGPQLICPVTPAAAD